ncbi:glutamate--cysteine ligase regulatory subunit-like [Centruroides sculpturatus]|uniref:glutamate--cysteine ligase regulatory subunit-like n=2 Tax=Centruroides sculpturatus TaxID=218467 RepID=UPI000C6C893A|nr:glutamate--cysteine ligase regulatory subunit-like [Centruroides sculpturatus]
MEGIQYLIIDTGNIMTLKDLQRKTTQTPTDELVESSAYTLKEWLNCSPPNKTNVLECVNKTKINQDDRQNLKLTVKIFLSESKPNLLINAVERTMSHLGVDLIDSLIVSVENTQITLGQIQPLWIALEEMVMKEKLVTIGFSDLDTNLLRHLYEWAKIKPSVNQVNLESCCVMPPEMIQFAKENDIQLLTHSDPKDILPHDMILKIFKETTHDIDPKSWGMQWITRYSVMVKGRGIIQSKGFILCLSKIT